MQSFLDHPVVGSRYFFPRRQDPPATLRVDVPVDGAVLACAAHRPHATAPTLVMFHGNGEVVADYLPELADAFAAVGLNTFFAEYRGYGGSTGTPAMVGMLDDVEAVLDAVGVPDEQLVIYGRSVGSIYAIEAAARRPAVRALVIESGISDPLSRVLMRVTPWEIGATIEQLRGEAARRLDHRTKLSQYGGPVLVLHTEHDDLVLPEHARANAAWASNSELILFDRGDHNSIHVYNLPAIVEAVARVSNGQQGEP
jgi:hypothetical protein